MPYVTEAVVMTACTLLGGLLKSIVDHFTGAAKAREDEFSETRQQIMAQMMAEVNRANVGRDSEIAKLRDEVAALRREVDTWQSKFHDARVELEVQRRENDRLAVELQLLKNRTAAGPLEGPAPL